MDVIRYFSYYYLLTVFEMLEFGNEFVVGCGAQNVAESGPFNENLNPLCHMWRILALCHALL